MNKMEQKEVQNGKKLMQNAHKIFQKSLKKGLTRQFLRDKISKLSQESEMYIER